MDEGGDRQTDSGEERWMGVGTDRGMRVDTELGDVCRIREERRELERTQR